MLPGLGAALVVGAMATAGCGDAAHGGAGSSFASLVDPGSGVGAAVRVGVGDVEPDDAGTLGHDADRTAEDVGDVPVCRLLPVTTVRRLTGDARLRAEASDSLYRSQCRYGVGDANVRVSVDGAPEATRRFFDMQAEALEFRSQGVGPPATLLHGIGDDTTYGVGAYWFPSRESLIAFHEDRIIRVIVHLPHRSSARLLGIGRQVTRLVRAGLPPAVDAP